MVAALRVAPSRWLQRLGALYVEIFRNVPLLVLLFISFAGLRRAGVGIGPWTAGIASLGVYTSAYVAEALRSGVFAVGSGQVEASLSLGFTQSADAARDRAAAGVPHGHPAARIDHDRDGQELGDRRRVAARARPTCSSRRGS